MKNNEIKISVIVPIYNTEKYLEKCLKSIINQSLREIEIICVNDGSTDNSLDILKRFQKEDKRIIILNKENGGVSSARNEALKIAKGKYCLNIDSDDWIEEEFFKEMYLKAEKYNLDLVISDIILDYDNKKLKIKKELEINENKIISGEEYRKLFFNKRLSVEGYTWNKLIKTSIYRENSIFYNENISFMEDYEIILKLAFYFKKIGKLNKTYYHYIQRDNSASHNRKKFEKNFLDKIIIFNNLEKFYENRDKNILYNLKREKIFSMQRSIFKNKEVSEKMYNRYLLELKKEKFIFSKNEGEKLKQIILYDVIKFFNSLLIIKAINKFYFK